MIAVLNRLVGFIEEHLTEEIDVAGLTTDLGTTEYHVRRMFSSLAGTARLGERLPLADGYRTIERDVGPPSSFQPFLLRS